MDKVLKYFLVVMLLSFGAGESYGFLNPKEIVTDKGLRVWFVNSPGSPVIAMQFAFSGGATSHQPGKEGAASLLGGLLEEGAGPHSKTEFHEVLQDHAISISFDVTQDYFYGELGTLKKNQAIALTLLGHVLNRPHLSDASFQKVKSHHMAYLSHVSKQPGYIGKSSLRTTLFPKDPYGQPVEGRKVSVQNIKLDDLKQYHLDHFVQSGLVIGLTGDLTEAEVKSFVDTAFGELPEKGQTAKLTDVMPVVSQKVEVKTLPIPQSIVFFSQPGIKYGDPHFIEASMLMHIMAGDSTSRLFKEVREKRGLVYAVGAGLSPMKRSGLISGQLGSSNATTLKAIEVVKAEWKRMHDEGVTQEELQDTQSFLLGHYPFSFTTSGGIAGSLLGNQIAKRPLTYYQDREKLITQITRDQLNKVAKELFKPGALYFLVVGAPYGQEKTKMHKTQAPAVPKQAG
jgi:zinc protease